MPATRVVTREQEVPSSATESETEGELPPPPPALAKEPPNPEWSATDEESEPAAPKAKPLVKMS